MGPVNKTVRSRFLNHKNPFVRKGFALALSLPRAARRLTAKSNDYAERPPIFCNSIPKSGTHLLKQIALGLSNNIELGAFLSSTPSITHVERPESDMLRRIRMAVPGEVVLGHIFYNDRFPEAFHSVNAVHFFLYRDPRDVAISEAHYLRSQNRWHKFHRIFAAAANIDEAILLSIRGARDQKTGAVIESIADRYSLYTGWRKSNAAFCVRYEELAGDDAISKVREMAEFYLKRSRRERSESIEAMADRALKSIAPGRSHTFRRGIAGGWRREMTEEAREAFKEVAGELLIELGYERDLSW